MDRWLIDPEPPNSNTGLPGGNQEPEIVKRPRACHIAHNEKLNMFATTPTPSLTQMHM